jgi:hypothetical protein
MSDSPQPSIVGAIERCEKDHTAYHVPDSGLYKLTCGDTVIARAEFMREPAMEVAQAWFTTEIERHREATP